MSRGKYLTWVNRTRQMMRVGMRGRRRRRWRRVVLYSRWEEVCCLFGFNERAWINGRTMRMSGGWRIVV